MGESGGFFSFCIILSNPPSLVLMIPLILLSSDGSLSPNSVWCLVCPKGTLLSMELGGHSRKLHHR